MKIKFTKPQLLNFLFSSVLSTLVLVSVMSCKDDEDDSAPANKFTIGDTTVVIKRGVFFQDATAADFYSHSITFLSDGLKVTDGTTEGKGSMAGFSFYTKSSTPAPGTYNFTGEEIQEEGNVWSAGAVRSVVQVAVNGSPLRISGRSYDFKSGKIEVKKSGETYTIDLAGKVVEVGKSTEVDFACNYTGTLEPVVKD